MAAGSSSSSSSSSSPCAACKLLRRRCSRECIFAPYFPADEPHKFACVHKVFGASNVNKMLQELSETQRGDAVSAMVYEAYARMRDPVYGCAGAISSLQQQVDILQSQLAVAQAQVAQMRVATTTSQSPQSSSSRSRSRMVNSRNMYGSPDHHRHFEAADTTTAAAAMMTDDQEDNSNNNNNARNYSLWSY